MLHVMFNAYWDPLVFELPPTTPGQPRWRLWIDTYRDAPEDIHEPPFGPLVQGPTYTVQPLSLVTLFAEGMDATAAAQVTLATPRACYENSSPGAHWSGRSER